MIKQFKVSLAKPNRKDGFNIYVYKFKSYFDTFACRGMPIDDIFIDFIEYLEN